jgi:hypothetical protein
MRILFGFICWKEVEGGVEDFFWDFRNFFRFGFFFLILGFWMFLE